MDCKRVTVVGSYNVGLFLKGQRLPKFGETIIGDEFHEGGGGKGSNQAIAASYLGGKVNFIGRIGNDKYGQDALAMYRRIGVSTDFIQIDKTIHSGISVILIDKDGNNIISVIPGANFNLCQDDINKAEHAVRNSKIVGFQLENRLNIIDYAIRKVHSMGIATLLDPAPAVKLPKDLYPYIDYIKPNETEASILTDIEVKDFDSAKKAARWFIDNGVKNVIITLGKRGAILVRKDDSATYEFEPPKVEAVDTTGAGDVFSGALMAELSNGADISNAIEFANHAAALSVTKLGVIEAIPHLDEVKAFMGHGSCNSRGRDIKNDDQR